MNVSITSRNGNVISLRATFKGYPSLTDLASAQASIGLMAGQPNSANIRTMDKVTYVATWTSVLNEQGEGITLS
jgi:hypothetical protein